MDVNEMEKEMRRESISNWEKERQKIACLKELVAAVKDGDQITTLQATVKLLSSTSSSNLQSNSPGNEATSSLPEELNLHREALYAYIIDSLEEKKDTDANGKPLIPENEGRRRDLDLNLQVTSNGLTSTNQQFVDLRVQLDVERSSRGVEQACYSMVIGELKDYLHQYLVENYDLKHKVEYLNKLVEVMHIQSKVDDKPVDQMLTPESLVKQIIELKQLYNDKETQERLNVTEKKLQDLWHSSENRIIALEAQIAQLTEKFKIMENLTHDDQLALQIFIDQLDIKTFISPQPPDDHFDDEFVNVPPAEILIDQVDIKQKDSSQVHPSQDSDQECLKTQDEKPCDSVCYSPFRNPVYENRIVQNHNVLTTNLTCNESFLSHFIENRIFSYDDCDEILRAGTSAAKNFKFLHLVQTRGDFGFDPFYSALVSTHQYDLADKLMPHIAPSRNHFTRMVQEQGSNSSDYSPK